jgi:hypothetical protein
VPNTQRTSQRDSAKRIKNFREKVRRLQAGPGLWVFADNRPAKKISKIFQKKMEKD